MQHIIYEADCDSESISGSNEQGQRNETESPIRVMDAQLTQQISPNLRINLEFVDQIEEEEKDQIFETNWTPGRLSHRNCKSQSLETNLGRKSLPLRMNTQRDDDLTVGINPFTLANELPEMRKQCSSPQTRRPKNYLRLKHESPSIDGESECVI